MYRIKIYNNVGALIGNKVKCFAEVPEIEMTSDPFGMGFDLGSASLALLYSPQGSSEMDIFIRDTFEQWRRVEIWAGVEKIFDGEVDRAAEAGYADGVFTVPLIGRDRFAAHDDFDYEVAADELLGFGEIFLGIKAASGHPFGYRFYGQLGGVAKYLRENYPEDNYHTGIGFSSSGDLFRSLAELAWIMGGRFVPIPEEPDRLLWVHSGLGTEGDVTLGYVDNFVPIAPDGELHEVGYSRKPVSDLSINTSAELYAKEKDEIAKVQADYTIQNSTIWIAGNILEDAAGNQWEVFDATLDLGNNYQQITFQRYPEQAPEVPYLFPTSGELENATNSYNFDNASYIPQVHILTSEQVQNYLESEEISPIGYIERYLKGYNYNIKQGEYFAFAGKTLFASEIKRDRSSGECEITGIEVI